MSFQEVSLCKCETDEVAFVQKIKSKAGERQHCEKKMYSFVTNEPFSLYTSGERRNDLSIVFQELASTYNTERKVTDFDHTRERLSFLRLEEGHCSIQRIVWGVVLVPINTGQRVLSSGTAKIGVHPFSISREEIITGVMRRSER
jgi:hypothetical protein